MLIDSVHEKRFVMAHYQILFREKRPYHSQFYCNLQVLLDFDVLYIKFNADFLAGN